MKNSTMPKILFFYVSTFFYLASPLNLNAAEHKKITHIDEIAFYCEPAVYKNFFCTNSPFDEAVLILYLHKLERKKVYGTVKAFRIMPSIHNLTQKTIRSAVIRVSFIGDQDNSKDLIINKKIIHKELSDTEESFLIRSDVPY